MVYGLSVSGSGGNGVINGELLDGLDGAPSGSGGDITIRIILGVISSLKVKEVWNFGSKYWWFRWVLG